MQKRKLACSVVVTLFSAVALAAQTDGSFDKSVTVSGPVELDVKTDSGGITVVRGGAGTVRVHAILKAQHNWFGSGDVAGRIRELERNPPVEKSGNQVRIGYVRDRDLLKGVSMRLEIETPADTQVRARADSGGIRVDGVQGPVDVHTDSGGIEVHNIASDVRAAADSGGIHISNINGAVTAHVDSGGIEASEVAGNIDAKADSGSIRLSQTKAAPIHVRSDSGGVSVKLAPGLGYDAQLETSSGHIRVPEMTANGSFSSHRVDGKIHGGGPLIDIHVDSGGITVE
jgi:Putative adhesin